MGWDYKHPRYMGPTAGAALFGAVIGGVAAAAANARKVKDGKMSGQEAALDALREAGTTGISTGAGVAAMCRLGVGGFAGLLGVTVVAAGTKYLLDNVVANVLGNALEKGCACAKAAYASAAPAGTEAAAATSTGTGSKASAAKAPGAAKTSATAKAGAKPAKPAKPRAPRKAPAKKAEPETYITE